MCVGVGVLRGMRDCGCGTICSYVGLGCSCVEGGYVDISGRALRQQPFKRRPHHIPQYDL